MPVEQLPDDIRELPKAERAQLAHLLIQSLDVDEDENPDELWKEEVERRSEDIRWGRVSCRPVGEVLERVRRKLRDALPHTSRG